MLPNRQEHDYASCPTTKGWLRLARPLRAGSASLDPRGLAPPRPTSRGRLCLARCPRASSASPDPQGLDSTSPDAWGQTPPLPMTEGWLRLARRLGAGSTSPDVLGQTPPHPTGTPCSFIRISAGYDMTFESNVAPRTMPCAAAGKVPLGYGGMGALDHSSIAEYE